MGTDSLDAQSNGGRISGFTLAEVVIAVAILVLAFGGIISAYIQITRRAEWTGYSLAAQALAVQQLEVARSAVWDPAIGRNDFTNGIAGNLLNWTWTWNAATQTGVGSGYTTNILDIPISGTNITRATNYVTVRMFFANGSASPPVQLQMVKVETAWPFAKGKTLRYYTNTAASYFAPDNRDPNSL